MNMFFELGNRYAAKSDWRDFALTKFCLFSLGLMIGVCLPARHRKTALLLAGGVFAATYLPLMKKVFRIAKEMLGEQK